MLLLGEWYNTALIVGGNGVLGEYYKNRPVHFFKDGMPGKSFDPIDTPLGKIGTPGGSIIWLLAIIYRKISHLGTLKNINCYADSKLDWKGESYGEKF